MYYSLAETKTFDSPSNSYVNYLALNAIQTQLAVNLSNESIEVLDSQTLKRVSLLKAIDGLNPVMKFSPQNNNQLFVCTSDAIKVYDLRHSGLKCAKQFKLSVGIDTNINELNFNQFLCFDFNSDFTYICVGTEATEKDKTSYLYFWDIRRPALVLGTYCESHTNDITDVCFDPKNRHVFASGSCDELINVFDLNQTDEEEALITTLNVEAAVERIHWSSTNDNHLVCLTQDESIHMWDVNEVSPSVTYSGLSSHSFDYVIDYLPKVDQIYVGDKNHTIKSFDLNARFADETIVFSQMLSKGHNKLVRTVATNSDNSVIYSGGEDGIVSVWNRLQSCDNLVLKIQTKGKTKIKGKDKSRSQPY